MGQMGRVSTFQIFYPHGGARGIDFCIKFRLLFLPVDTVNKPICIVIMDAADICPNNNSVFGGVCDKVLRTLRPAFENFCSNSSTRFILIEAFYKQANIYIKIHIYTSCAGGESTWIRLRSFCFCVHEHFSDSSPSASWHPLLGQDISFNFNIPYQEFPVGVVSAKRKLSII